MSRLRRWWSFWVELFDRREPATTFACVRVGIGLVLVYHMVSAAHAGLVDTLWVDQSHGGFMPIRGNWLLVRLGGATPTVIWTLFAITLASAGMLIIGLASRVAALAALLSFGALVTTHGDTSGGADLLTTNALWMLVFARSDQTLSVWSRLRHGRWRSDVLVPAWPRMLLIFQLVIVYFAAGVQKTSVHWTPFGGYTALHYVFQDPTWVRWSQDAFVSLSPLSRLATAITWHWEQLTPILLLHFAVRNTEGPKEPGRIRRFFTRFDVRKGWVAIGVMLHAGILLTLNVGAFSLVATTYYFALWKPEELSAAAVAVRRRFRARRSQEPG